MIGMNISQEDVSEYSGDKLIGVLKDMYGTQASQRESIETIADKAGLDVNILTQFIKSQYMTKTHPKEQLICQGVIKYYETYGVRNMFQKNDVTQMEEEQLIEFLKQVVDFKLWTMAETRQVVHYFQVKQSAVDRRIRVILSKYDKDRAEQYEKYSNERYRVASVSKSRRYHQWFRGLMPSEQLLALNKATKIIQLKHDYTPKRELLQMLLDNKTIVFGEVDLSENEVSVVSGYQGSLRELNKQVNTGVKPLFKSDKRRSEYLECVLQPFAGKSIEDECELAENELVYVLYIRQFADEPAVSETKPITKEEEDTIRWNESGEPQGKVPDRTNPPTNNFIKAYTDAIRRLSSVNILSKMGLAAEFMYPQTLTLDGFVQLEHLLEYFLLVRSIFVYDYLGSVKMMHVNLMTHEIEAFIETVGSHKVYLESFPYVTGSTSMGLPRIRGGENGDYYINIQCATFLWTQHGLVTESDVTIGRVHIEALDSVRMLVKNVYMYPFSPIIMRDCRQVGVDMGQLTQRITTLNGELTKYIGNTMRFQELLKPTELIL